MDTTKRRRIIRLPTVEEMTGLAGASIYRGMSAGWFPKAIGLGANSVGWIEDEINGWIEQRITARNSGGERTISPNIGKGRTRKAVVARMLETTADDD
jgi:prophage regulatory protein